MKPAVRVENLAKRYQIGSRPFGRYRTLRETIADAAKAPFRRLRRPGNGQARIGKAVAARPVHAVGRDDVRAARAFGQEACRGFAEVVAVCMGDEYHVQNRGQVATGCGLPDQPVRGPEDQFFS